MKFRFWKDNFNAFQIIEKVIFMVFSHVETLFDVWCIKTNFLFKYCMQWLQEYCFLHVGTFCDASKRIFFWSLVCNDCKNIILVRDKNRLSESIFLFDSVLISIIKLLIIFNIYQ